MRELRRTLAVFASTLLVLSTAACAFDTGGAASHP